MWEKIFNWFLDLIPNIASFGEWLFTPINVNIVSERLESFYKDYGQTFMGDGGGTWGYTFLNDLIADAVIPIYITPIQVLSTTFLTIVFGILIVKFIVK